jgi:hypothetical protein
VIGLISHFSTKFFASSIQLVQPTNLETPAPINIANFLSLTALFILLGTSGMLNAEVY